MTWLLEVLTMTRMMEGYEDHHDYDTHEDLLPRSI